MLQTWIIEDSIKSQTIKEYCKCNTLEGYVSYINKNTLSQFDNFSLINEDQTILSTNIPAIQLEYEFTLADTKVHAFTIFTENNDSFYQLSYYADSEFFSNSSSNFKAIIDTIDFLHKKRKYISIT